MLTVEHVKPDDGLELSPGERQSLSSPNAALVVDMRVSTRLVVSMVCLVAGAAGAVGWLSHGYVKRAVLPGQLLHLHQQAVRSAADLARQIARARDDLEVLASSPTMAGLVEALESEHVGPDVAEDLESWRARLTPWFRTLMRNRPEYLQVRVIGTGADGREVVRLERDAPGGPPTAVPWSDLQAKGDRPYFRATMALHPSEVYTSPIELNREHDRVEEPYKPVVRVATPVAGAQGQNVAMLVINVDLRAVIEALRSAAPQGGAIYLVSDRGDFALHPDRSREFGLDLGRGVLFEQELPEVARRAAQVAVSSQTVEAIDGEETAVSIVPIALDENRRAILVEVVPREVLLVAASTVTRSSLLMGSLAALVAALLAALLALSISRPLTLMTEAVRAFGETGTVDVPTDATGEVGILARSFEEMAEEIARQNVERERAEARFRLAVESSPSGMIIVNPAGSIVLANTEVAHMFGYTREEMLGLEVDALVPAGLRTVHATHRANFLEAPEARRIGENRDLFGMRKDGSEFPVEVGLTPIRVRDDLLVLGAVLDLTARKGAEAELAAKAEELERSNQELEQFAYVASHDLQEPLRTVASFTELLADATKGNLDARTEKFMYYITDGARRMQQLINDLLAFSRVTTRGKSLAPTDSQGVLRQALRSLATAIQETGAEVTHGELPTVEADAVQLGQVFVNLIGNALKFRSDRPSIVRIDAEPDGAFWRFTVKDNGIGIEAEHFDRIFHMFQRLHDRASYSGSGIGLALCKRIVERHGGHIEVASSPGEGSAFTFLIPKSQAAG